MRVILDTNVLVSGIFFSGPPYQILKAWRDGKIQLVVSPDIIDEYERVIELLGKQFPGVDFVPILDLILVQSDETVPKPLRERVCDDPDDDKFIACALSSKSKIIVSGDKKLQKVSGYHGIRILSPRKFLDDYL